MNLLPLKRCHGGLPALIGLLVAVHGLAIITDTLVAQLGVPRFPLHISSFSIDLPLLLGLALVYISRLLRRRKYSAWVLATALYIFLLGLSAAGLVERTALNRAHLLIFILALLILGILLLARKEFVVRSDIRTVASAARVSALVLLAALLYGTGGFLLMDERDFHQDISPPAAIHYTIDQFDLTTNPLQPHTRRAHLFLDSLTFISVTAVGFTFISLFQPLRARYGHQKDELTKARELVYAYPTSSQDFFKLWPEDKTYFFSQDRRAGVAYKVQRGVALVLGDPFGKAASIGRLLDEFEDLCFVNGWRPAFIQATSRWQRQFERRGYRLQLIGKEAIVHIAHFEAEVAPSGSFKRTAKRFEKLGFTTELCQPPHHEALLKRLQVISDEWLQRLSRSERTFTMGYFHEPYFQQCALLVMRDAAGTIQGFLNLVPAPLPEEATFDMLRTSHQSPSGSSDYLLGQLLADLRQRGYRRLSLSLCPLVGLDQAPNTLINRTLRFVYSNGDRLYSFQGLYKFKAKYQPEWHERYEIYKGGMRDFTQVMRALARAMKT